MSNQDVPVAFMPAHSGNFIIRASDHQSLGLQTSIYLEDLQTGALADLLDNPEYSFAATAGDNVNRFVLHFGYPVITGMSNNVGPRVCVFPNPAKEILNVTLTGFTGTATLKITDNLGRVLYSTVIETTQSNSQTQIDISEFSAGMYLLNIETNEGNKVTTFVKN
jgi:hypothetical protein